MQWIYDFDLFLFDFDGLLVNTEDLHYQAYQRLCQRRGHPLPWSFERYCLAAHFDSTGLRDQIYKELPALEKEEPRWDVLYQEKKQAYVELLHEEDSVTLMPGIEKLLLALQEANKKRCVVTHSPLKHVSFIRGRNPLLDTIPDWFTREHYSRAKPDPECYFKAIGELSEDGDRIIGFEDTPRGLKALQQVPAKSLLVTEIHYTNMEEILGDESILFPNIEAISSHSLV